jgi:hypothetical protein
MKMVATRQEFSRHPSWLLDPDHHGIVAGERLDARLFEARLAHPCGALGPSKVKTAMRIDEHGKAHEQTVGMLAPVVVDERLVHEEVPCCTRMELEAGGKCVPVQGPRGERCEEAQFHGR